MSASAFGPRQPALITCRAVAGFASAAAATSCLYAGDAADFPSLGEAASKAGLLFGSDSDSVIEDEPPPYAELIRRRCVLFAPMFQWSLTETHESGPDPDWEDPNIRFARRANMQLSGGHFIWHERVPGWFDTISSHDQLARSGGTRNRSAHHRDRHSYAGDVFSWNVVNEGLDPGHGRSDGMRRTRFLEIFGEAFFEFGFHAARAADPFALLVYNDYGMEMANAAQERRRRALISLLGRMVARGVPVDAIGLQAHLRLDQSVFDPIVYRNFLQEIADCGVRILINELDVLDDGRQRDAALWDADIANFYARFLEVALDQTAVISVVTWGLSDRYTWLSPTLSPDLNLPAGPPARPLPFDEYFRPKPAAHAMLTAFRAAPTRPRVRHS